MTNLEGMFCWEEEHTGCVCGNGCEYPERYRDMTLKEEQCPDPTSRKFYLVIEIQDFTFDKPLDEFSKAVHKEVTQAVVELREVIQEAYLKHNSAGVWESDNDGTE